MSHLNPARECPERIDRLCTWRESVMSVLAIAFLVLVSYSLRYFERAPPNVTPGPVLGCLLGALWLAISAEAIAGFWSSRDYSWSATSRVLLLCLLPPYRLSVSTLRNGRCIWLPLIGWQYVDHRFIDRLERSFSVPMLSIALLILPILAMEILWAHDVARSSTLTQFLDLGAGAVWLAFAIEFIVMSAVAEKRLAYIARHWLNLAIIALPFLAFLRGLRMIGLLRLANVTRAFKLVRVRGLAVRAWKGMVTLDLAERVLHRGQEARLRNLRLRLAAQERYLEHLRARIRVLEVQRSAVGQDVDRGDT